MSDDLHQWITAAAQILQEICDDAQQAAGNPFGEDQRPDVRAILNELDAILAEAPLLKNEHTATARPH